MTTISPLFSWFWFGDFSARGSCGIYHPQMAISMMTSSNGNIFRVTGPLCGEFTGPGEFPTQRPVTQSFDVSLICVWINGWVNNREAGNLRCLRSHYDVNVMQLLTCLTDNEMLAICATAWNQKSIHSNLTMGNRHFNLECVVYASFPRTRCYVDKKVHVCIHTYMSMCV